MCPALLPTARVARVAVARVDSSSLVARHAWGRGHTSAWLSVLPTCAGHQAMPPLQPVLRPVGQRLSLQLHREAGATRESISLTLVQLFALVPAVDAPARM